MAANLEERIRQTGLKLYALAAADQPSLFKKDYWTGKIMDWSMKNEAFKKEMFRFVDVFPCLKHPESIARHIQEYFCRPDQDFPKSMQWGLKMVKPDSMAAKMAAKSIQKNIQSMGRQFITGADLDEAAPVLKKIRNTGVAWTVKILKEAVKSRRDEEDFMEKQLALMEDYQSLQANWPALGDAGGDLDWGFTPKTNISLMASCLYSQYLEKAPAFEYMVDMAAEKLRAVYRKAIALNAYVMLDMEHLPARAFTLELFKRVNAEPEFRDYPHKGIAYQSYLRDSEPLLKELLAWAKKKKQNFGIRLIKGAFWDEEVVLANQFNYPVPVYTVKAHTDANFERCARHILNHHKQIMLKCGSHNIRSVAFSLETARDLKVPPERLEFQMLHGMAENLRTAFVRQGLRLRLYAPVGEIIPGMAYLVRRLLENTSNESFLRLSFADGESREALLRNPAQQAPPAADAALKPAAAETAGAVSPFTNEPPMEWTAEHRVGFAAALKKARGRFPRHIPIIIDGREIETQNKITSCNPNQPDEVVARAACADRQTVDQAVAAAEAAFSAWRQTPPAARSACLFKSAAHMRKQRNDLAALLVFEAGKNWNEAHADINEAIDFLEYYGREMIRLASSRPMARFPGETSNLVSMPRGVGAVIAPWNFALPISVGMCAAAVVSGNTVVYKPASQTTAVGEAVYRLFAAGGLPRGVLNFLPGAGAEVGAPLVSHPMVSFTVFTGSRTVGLDIIERCAKADGHGRHVKKVVAEMGGKNAVIVDADADLDEAVGHIMRSAFSYMGQKCSACSRLIVLSDIYDKFVGQLKRAVQTLFVGPAEDPRSDVGAVIDAAAQAKINAYIDQGKKDGTLLVEQTLENAPGFFVPPTVFENLPPGHVLGQEEIFGPVVCVFRATDFEKALSIANDTPYALTGGVFSRSPANIEAACNRFEVGNLYINRGITGALVQRHPFGGFKMSGVGSKAMGPDYLPQFMFSRTIVENTFRSGFAPMEEGR